MQTTYRYGHFERTEGETESQADEKDKASREVIDKWMDMDNMGR
jgi:hypothetical protein